MEPELQLEPTGPRSITGGLALVALVAVVALAIGVAAMTKGSAAANVASASMAPASITPATGTAAPTGLAHFDGDGLAFDYPAAWTFVHSGYVSHYVTILDYLGTSSDLQAIKDLPTCSPDLDFGGEHSTRRCGSDLRLGTGQILVTLYRADGPPRTGPIDPNDTTSVPLGPGSKYVTVGGLPAIYSESTSAGELKLEWSLSVPEQVIPRYFLEVRIAGPAAAQMKAQAETLIASIRYDPPVAVLLPADGPRIAALALAELRKNDASFDCFPTTPGRPSDVTVTQLPMTGTLTKPLPVTCVTAIEANPIGLWKMTLTATWSAAHDRTAGSFITYVWVDAGGVPGMTGGGPGADIPYQPAVPTS